jgi:hypothetical protein
VALLILEEKQWRMAIQMDSPQNDQLKHFKNKREKSKIKTHSFLFTLAVVFVFCYELL